MRHQPWTRGPWTRVSLTVALVLVATFGFCMFQGDHDGDHHAGSVHICLAMAANTLGYPAVTGLLALGAALVLPLPRVAAVTLGVALPPPKSTVSL